MHETSAGHLAPGMAPGVCDLTLDLLPAMVWRADAGLGLLHCNPAWLAFTGRKAAAERGDGWLEGVHPDSLGGYLAAADAARAAGTPFEAELLLRHRDGGFRRVRLQAVPIPAGGWLGSAAELGTPAPDGEAQFDRVIESSRDCIKLLDLEGRLLFMSRAGQRLLEIERIAPLLGNSWIDIWPEPAREAARAAVAAAAAGATGEFVDACPTTSGRRKWWDVVITPVPGADGRPERLLCISRDITDRREQEQAIRQSEAEYRAIFELSATGIGIAERTTGRMMRANPSFCAMLGYSREELLGLSFMQVTYPEDLARNLDLHGQMMRGEIGHCTLEKRFIRKNGELFWAQVTATVVPDAAGRTLSTIAMVDDISERKRAEQALRANAGELRRLNAELEEFAYAASHDLKAPLRAVSNLALWIAEDLGPRLDADNRARLDLLRQRVARMDRLINGMLAYAHLGSGEPPEPERVEVGALLAGLVAEMQLPGGFSVEAEGELPVLITVPVYLSQVFQNLIGNAVKHHDRPGGCVRIRALEAEGMWCFEVADDGPGIPPEQRANIFKMFATLKRRDELENTGIGLALVKKLVARYGGRVEVEENHPRGARFRFFWPRETVSRAAD